MSNSVTCQQCGTEFKRKRGYRSLLCSERCRFVAKFRVNDETGCWDWQAHLSGSGYGQFASGGRDVQAHRWSYQHLGEQQLVDEMQVDHLCRNRICVNPDHLEQVTQRENIMRGQSPAIITYLTGVCKRGHSMDDAITNSVTGRRRCRTCYNAMRRAGYIEPTGETRTGSSGLQRIVSRITDKGRQAVKGL